MASDQSGLVTTFLEEAGELVSDFEDALLQLETTPTDAELLNRIFRCAHTLKGNSGLLGFDGITVFTHQLENVLVQLRRGALVSTSELVNVLLESTDVVKALLADVTSGRTEPSDTDKARSDAVIVKLKAFSQSASKAPPVVKESAKEKKDRRSSIPLGLHLFTVPPQDTPAASIPAAVPVTPQNETPPVVGATSEKLLIKREATPAPAQAAAAPAEAASIRVPIERVDRLVNLVGEIVIAQSMVKQLVGEFSPERLPMLIEAVTQMDRYCRDLQERVLGVRMVPVKTLFGRFQRLVRDVSSGCGKRVNLVLSGEETELDKTVIEKIGDPLIHLLRNAVDHGVEASPEARRACGKPEAATVHLSAYQKGGSVFIEVQDDGRGLNREKILAKARSLGLVKSGYEPTDDEVCDFIMQPGFSTADKVTELSGRGVGMDVVRRNVEALKGTIEVSTNPGNGTLFRIKLPLTLAVVDGLAIKVGDQVYVVPLIAVVESVRPAPGTVRCVANSGEFVNVRGQYLPLVRLHSLFDVTTGETDPYKCLIVILDDGANNIAVLVDELIGQYQVVVKTLEANYRAVPGISGATILGDGRVALILDTSGISTLVRSGRGVRIAEGGLAKTKAPEERAITSAA